MCGGDAGVASETPEERGQVMQQFLGIIQGRETDRQTDGQDAGEVVILKLENGY